MFCYLDHFLILEVTDLDIPKATVPQRMTSKAEIFLCNVDSESNLLQLVFQNCLSALKEKTEIQRGNVGIELKGAYECNSTNTFSVSTSGQALCWKQTDQTVI